MTYTLEIWDDSTDSSWSGVTFYHREEGMTHNFCVIGDEAGFVDSRSYLWRVTAIDEYGLDTQSGVSGFAIDNQNPLLGWIAGLVYDVNTDQPILDAQVSASGLNISMSGTGYYLGVGPSTGYTFLVSAGGYATRSIPGIQVPEGGLVQEDFWLEVAADTDGDGMPDDWENLYGVDDASGDPDGDGLSNLLEYQNQTNPTKADTDGDNMPDGWEVYYGLNPLVNDAGDDPDNDGWTTLQEYQRGTEPDNVNSHPARAMPWLLLLLED